MAKNENQKNSKLAALGRLDRRRGSNYDNYLHSLAHQEELEARKKRIQERNMMAQKGKFKDEGPRGKFREYLQDPNLTVDEAIDKFVKEQSAFLRQMLEGWLKEDSELGRIPESAVKKVEQYLAKKEQGREDDDDAR